MVSLLAALNSKLVTEVYTAAFHDGLEKFKDYLQETGANFSAEELISIMNSFSDPFYQHLKEEPPAIVNLAQYDTPEHPIDILGIASKSGKKQVSLPLLFNTLPVFFLNMETVEFEGGLWHEVFPPVPAPVKWVLTKGAPMWHQRYWKFASCTADGKFKQLAV